MDEYGGGAVGIVVDDNRLFRFPVIHKEGRDIVLTDEGLRDKISALLESGPV